jgi:catechol 2,3-dioxygenase-like lactoylglutathione lyase family enzyme
MTVVTSKLATTRRFYETHFDARPIFDCGWYVVLRFDSSGTGPEICLMEAKSGMEPFSGGTVLNLLVDDADTVHNRLTEAGLATMIALEDHPWGDRGFAVQDPNGISIYLYEDREPSPEFKQYYKD